MGKRVRDDLDPDVEAAYRRLMDASDKLASIRIQSAHEREGDWDTRRDVDDAMMQRLAGSHDASPELVRYSKRVAAGLCEWRDADQLAIPVPPEIVLIKRSPLFRWYPARDNADGAGSEPEHVGPYRIPWE